MDQQQEILKKKRVVDFFMKKNILLSPEFIGKMGCDFNEEEFYNHLSAKINDENFVFINPDLIEALNEYKMKDMNWHDIERSRVLYEKEINKKTYPQLLESFRKDFVDEKSLQKKEPGISNDDGNVRVLFSYEEENKKKDMQDFVSYFNARYNSIRKILSNRQEMQDVTSINKLKSKKDRGNVSMMGLVSEKSLTKNGNYVLTLEDPTGTIKVLINKNKPEMFSLARDIVLDEMIGVCGANGDNMVFVNNMLLPDIPLSKEMKRAPDETYALFLSDLHVGSNKFLPDKLDKFISWIRGESGSESQKDTASKVKYIFIIGDLVDGVGIYPYQDTELDIKDIYEQYNECAKFLKRIPERIKMIICPGNHDAMRISEPQPQLYKDFAEAIWKLPNAIMVSNPALINIHSSDDFPGFDVLMYHGYSFDYFVANVDTIREQGGYDHADLIMKFLLQRRHLAPTHSATLYIPDNKKDSLVIEKVPDFFVTGHIHKAAAANYRNVTMICGSCWQSKTTFQEKVGHNPEPARVPLVNLQTRQVKMLRF
ncbi:hypothetical protein COV19_00635 [Candidatus Woesearchaeota archaeon CG10_big_fil_rev_8_21_14_0_10_44_13]|nr:MAG: hypothetical protein COV19_00635 [Candidatus Woesearchaeota archaeon CG10_big_fil_rev_8_21_14_0_10_44_13]